MTDTLTRYLVLYGDHDELFTCQADDAGHAVEQCKDHDGDDVHGVWRCEQDDSWLNQDGPATDPMTDLRARQYTRRNPLDMAKLVARVKYAWPGGYALALVMSDGGTLCPTCVRAEWRNIVQDWLWNRDTPNASTGWLPAGITNASEWEEEEYCDHCGTEIA